MASRESASERLYWWLCEGHYVRWVNLGKNVLWSLACGVLVVLSGLRDAVRWRS